MPTTDSTLRIELDSPVKAQNAGLFISRGNAVHPTRIIDSHELIFVVQGELELWEDSHTFRIGAGQTLHLWPGRKHGSTGAMPPGLRFYWIHFEIADDRPRHRPSDELALPSRIVLPQVARLQRHEPLERLFRFFLSEQETGTLRPASANLLTLLMLNEVAQQAQEHTEEVDTHVVATWAHTYIRMNFDRPITASKVAMALGYNVDYLGRIYRQTYDCTLTQAIQRQRVQKACEYLLNSQLTIDQIAVKCGFADSDYFRRVFRRVMQAAPSEYRDGNARLHITTH